MQPECEVNQDAAGNQNGAGMPNSAGEIYVGRSEL